MTVKLVSCFVIFGVSMKGGGSLLMSSAMVFPTFYLELDS